MFDKERFHIVQNPSEGRLIEMWLTMENEGLVDVVFYDGIIDSLKKFMNFSGKHLYSFYYDAQLVGFSWLTHLETTSAGKSCRLHYCTFRAGKRILRPATEHWINFLLKHYDFLFGHTPENNHSGVTFLKRVGFKVIGKIPEFAFIAKEGSKCDLIISYKKKEMV
jgi:hypothetical protein